MSFHCNREILLHWQRAWHAVLQEQAAAARVPCGSQVPSVNLLQHRLPTGSEPPSAGLHLLWPGLLHRLQGDCCSTTDLQWATGRQLPHHRHHHHHGHHHGLQGISAPTSARGTSIWSQPALALLNTGEASSSFYKTTPLATANHCPCKPIHHVQVTTTYTGELFHSFKTSFQSTLPQWSGHLILELPWAPTQRRGDQHFRFQEVTVHGDLLLHNCLHPSLAPFTTFTVCTAHCQNLDANNSKEIVLCRQQKWHEYLRDSSWKELGSTPLK